MEFNLFIIPITLILVQLLKRPKFLDATYIPFIAVGIGACLGAMYAVYYGVDLFVHVFYGVIYGASASGIYDTATAGSTLAKGV